MDRKTCFVISPIGKEDSKERQLADDLFELIVEPALEKYDFNIIRADKISASSSITSDIIQLIQNADLCIVDLTGTNPNVMYECGRRHETAMPSIMLMQQGQKLPFDVSDIRAITYSVESGRTVLSAVKTIQAYVDNLMQAGWEPRGSGESLSTLSVALQRIERKLDFMSKPTAATPQIAQPGVMDILKNLSPLEAFAYALSNDDYQLADRVVPYIINTQNDSQDIMRLLTPLVAHGARAAGEFYQNNLDTLRSLTGEIFRDSYAALFSFYGKNSLVEDNLEIIDELTEIGKTQAKTNKEQAFILNQKSRMYYVVDRYDDCLEIMEQVLELSPMDVSYQYNASLIYTKTGNSEKALQCIEQCLIISRDRDRYDADHLSEAYALLSANGKDELAQFALEQLKEINPFKADLVLKGLH